MTDQKILKSIAKATLIICVSAIVVGNIALAVFPAQKPAYAVMAKQRSEKALTAPSTSAHDSNSRTTPN